MAPPLPYYSLTHSLTHAHTHTHTHTHKLFHVHYNIYRFLFEYSVFLGYAAISLGWGGLQCFFCDCWELLICWQCISSQKTWFLNYTAVKTSYISYLWSLSLTVTSEFVSSLSRRLPLLKSCHLCLDTSNRLIRSRSSFSITLLSKYELM